jgi:ribosomal protein S18 acetylase RimI-like enzyme
VLDQAVYRSLSQARIASVPPGTQLDPGFFPHYRAPVVEPEGLSARTAERSLVVRPVGPDDAAALGELLARIDPTYFQPHPMTSDEAWRIATHAGENVYLLGFVDERAVAYGMLRGWDEGFRVPSLGLGVDRAFERLGYGRTMMHALHAVARERNARQVRLRVHPDNTAAAALYRSEGYAEVGVERNEILMLLDL